MDSHERADAPDRRQPRPPVVPARPPGADRAAGEYRVEATFAAAGTYLLFDEFTPRERARRRSAGRVTVGAPSAAAARLAVDLAPKTIGAARVALAGRRRHPAGREATLIFRLAEAATGEPIRDLQPYLGAPAHAVILSEDAARFAHTHGEAVGAAATNPAAHAGGHGSADHQSGDHQHGAAPRVSLPATARRSPCVTPSTPGLYKLWGQFQTHDGQVITADFVVRVAE